MGKNHKKDGEGSGKYPRGENLVEIKLDPKKVAVVDTLLISKTTTLIIKKREISSREKKMSNWEGREKESGGWGHELPARGERIKEKSEQTDFFFHFG